MRARAKRGWFLAGFALTVASGGVVAGEPIWIDKDEDESYIARHECSFVQAGVKFYLFGGRESAQTLDTYDPATDSWTTSATAPVEFNHFQATEYQGLVWVIGAFETNNFPNESPADAIFVFDPARNVWMEGPSIPADRRRGSTGLVVYEDRFYVVAGNTIGHNGGYVNWFDEYDPQTGSWTPLADAPGPRDHFHAAIVGDRLYALGGRLSGGEGGTFAPLIPEVDVFDFTTESWTRLPPSADLPTPRAAAAVAVFDGEVLVIGGEGNGQAYDTVEGFDPLAGDWNPRASLNHARHGTQAIVSGQGVYVTAGSPSQGGGRQKNMEVYDTDAPGGVASVAGLLSAPAAATVTTTSPHAITLSHAGGNEGVFVNLVELSGPDSGDFTLLGDVADPFLVPTSGSRDLLVGYDGTTDGASATLAVTYGGSETLSVALSGTTDAGSPGAVSSLSVDKSGTDLALSWTADCGAGDVFGIYRGDLSLGYDSIAPEGCDLTGTMTTIPTGSPSAEFFLVVPSLGALEGSYGRAFPSAERPPATSACHASTSIDACATSLVGSAMTEVVLRDDSVAEPGRGPVRANRYAAETVYLKIAPQDREIALTELRAIVVNAAPLASAIEWEHYDYELRLYDGVASARAAAPLLDATPPDHRELELSQAPTPWGLHAGSFGPSEMFEIKIDLSRSRLVVPANAPSHPVLALTLRKTGRASGSGIPAFVESRVPGPTDYLLDETGAWLLTELDAGNVRGGRLSVELSGVK